jgi:hypothetical protein
MEMSSSTPNGQVHNGCWTETSNRYPPRSETMQSRGRLVPVHRVDSTGASCSEPADLLRARMLRRCAIDEEPGSFVQRLEEHLALAAMDVGTNEQPRAWPVQQPLSAPLLRSPLVAASPPEPFRRAPALCHTTSDLLFQRDFQALALIKESQ